MERYHELKRIGKGSFGVVFLCEDVESKNRVVVKKIGERGGRGACVSAHDRVVDRIGLGTSGRPWPCRRPSSAPSTLQFMWLCVWLSPPPAASHWVPPPRAPYTLGGFCDVSLRPLPRLTALRCRHTLHLL